MIIKRRTFLKGTVATGALTVAVGSGFIKPGSVMAAWPEEAFTQKGTADAMSKLFGSASTTESGEIDLKTPDIAENGAVVPVSVTTSLAGVQSISIFIDKNPQPLACSCELTPGVEGYVSTRIKMGETSNVIAVVKTAKGLFSTKRMVKVTIGGCGG